ncbi:hypothetical protein [Neorhodopirellula pilleata]|nr:hypothetical protein [Neorhodopirellula pilleata]
MRFFNQRLESVKDALAVTEEVVLESLQGVVSELSASEYQWDNEV